MLFFVPYLYVFAAYLKLRRRRDVTSLLAGVVGFASVVLSIALSFVPASDIQNKVAFEAKVVGGVVGFMAIGIWLALRAGRRRT